MSDYKPNETDQRIIDQCDKSVRPRRRIELDIARRTIAAFRAAGFSLVADNGEEESAGNDEQLIENLFACDEARLIVGLAGTRAVNGWVYFVLGNDGFDVINDYTVNLEPWLAPVNEYAEQLSGDTLEEENEERVRRYSLRDEGRNPDGSGESYAERNA